jgi:hypothetical protein
VHPARRNAARDECTAMAANAKNRPQNCAPGAAHARFAPFQNFPFCASFTRRADSMKAPMATHHVKKQFFFGSDSGFLTVRY